MTYEFLGGKLEESSEEITSVALLSPACFLFIFFISLFAEGMAIISRY
jgi:hypothetical protein